jgi:hypothetical protein
MDSNSCSELGLVGTIHRNRSVVVRSACQSREHTRITSFADTSFRVPPRKDTYIEPEIYAIGARDTY